MNEKPRIVQASRNSHRLPLVRLLDKIEIGISYWIDAATQVDNIANDILFCLFFQT